MTKEKGWNKSYAYESRMTTNKQLTVMHNRDTAVSAIESCEKIHENHCFWFLSLLKIFFHEMNSDSEILQRHLLELIVRNNAMKL